MIFRDRLNHDARVLTSQPTFTLPLSDHIACDANMSWDSLAKYFSADRL